MRRKRFIHKLISAVLPLLFLMQVSFFALPDMPAKAAGGETDNFANLVIFVNFQDTDHTGHSDSVMGKCFNDADSLSQTLEMFDGDDLHPRGMRQYLYNISYGAFRLDNVFPQYNAENNQIYPYTMSRNLDYYCDNDGILLKEIADILNQSGQLDASVNLDRNGDGVIDNIMVVVPCEEGMRNEKYYGHQAFYGGADTIGGKMIGPYNIVTESEAYLGLGGSGLLIHEFMHTIGYPDLYRKNGSASGNTPVGAWDIMAQESVCVQYPLAYFRAAVSNWFSIPTVTQSRKGYSLYSATAATADTKDKQAVILKTDYSSTEFFVVEFRQKGETYSSTDYDTRIPGSGLVIYRINTSQDSNTAGPPDCAYVFRPGDSADENGYEQGAGSISTSFLSLESGRTSYGTTDLSKTLEDGAITYSDGTNSGIMICNVGSADGNQITFDITFADLSESGYWTLESEDTTGTAHTEMVSCAAADGQLYYLLKNSSSANLYSYKNGVWTRLGTVPDAYCYQLALYENRLYMVSCSDSGIALSCWNGSGWSAVYSKAVSANEVAVTADEKGLYFGYVSMDENQVYVNCYTSAGGVRPLGGQVNSATKYVANLQLSAAGGYLTGIYRDAFDNNRIYIKKYSADKNAWEDVGKTSFNANYAAIKINGNHVYMVKNGTTLGMYDTYVYRCDLADENAEWIQLGENTCADEGILGIAICFNGTVPYVSYMTDSGIITKYLSDNKWTSLGQKTATGYGNGLNSYYRDGKMYVTALNISSGKVFIKSFGVQAEETPTPDPTPVKTDATVETTGIYVMEVTNQRVIAGLCTTTSKQADVEFRWQAFDEQEERWILVQDWCKNNEWLNWSPPHSGGYVLYAEARVVGNESSCVNAAVGVVMHRQIKGICQMPYTGEGGGYLIGVESYDNPNQSYRYELLILDCTLLAQGKPAWTYTTGKQRVSEGKAFWTVWQPEYGYYWTLFRVYDENGTLLDEDCFGFENVY